MCDEIDYDAYAKAIAALPPKERDEVVQRELARVEKHLKLLEAFNRPYVKVQGQPITIPLHIGKNKNNAPR